MELAGKGGFNKSFLKIRENNHSIQLPIRDITMLKSVGNYTIIYIAGGKQILTAITLKDWVKKIDCPSFFIRTHRSFLINKIYLSEIMNNKEVKVENRYIVPVSRRSDFALDYFMNKKAIRNLTHL